MKEVKYKPEAVNAYIQFYNFLAIKSVLTFVVVQYIVATSDHNLVSINSCSNFCCVSLGATRIG